MTFDEFRLKMRERRSRMKGRDQFRQAALAYAGARVTIITLTLLFISAHGFTTAHLLRLALRILIISHFMYAGMKITSGIVALLCLTRGAMYAANFFINTGYSITFPISGANLELMWNNGAGNPALLVNALLMFAVVAMITRALIAARSGKPAEPVPVLYDGMERVGEASSE